MDFNEAFPTSSVSYGKISDKLLKESIISSGSRGFNLILTGTSKIGYVRGRVYEIFGNEGCGKTTLLLEAIADCQKHGGKAMFVDAEHALNWDYARKLKVKIEELKGGEPTSGEEAFEMIEWGVNEKFNLIGVDSVAAMTPIEEIEGNFNAVQMGAHARLMGKGLRKINSMMNSKTETVIIYLNQIRYKIGVSYGSPETRPGGQALKFFTTGGIVDLRDPRADKITEGGSEIGKKVTAKTKKCKFAAPFQKCVIPILYGQGIDKLRDLMEALKKSGNAEFTNATITIKGRPRMNVSNFRDKLKKDSDFRKKIMDMVVPVLIIETED